MNTIIRWFDDSHSIRLGLSLVHFLWQGALLGAVAGMLTIWMKRARSEHRYAMLLALLAAMAIAPVVTFMLLPAPPINAESSDAAAPSPLAAGELLSSTTGATPMQSDAPRAAYTTANNVGHGAPPIAETGIAFQSRLNGAWEWTAKHLSWIVASWVLGVCLFSVRLAIGLAGVSRVRRNGIGPEPDACRAMRAELAALLGLSRVVAVCESAIVKVPVVVGWFKPIVLLPASVIAGLPEPELRAVLAHEFAHIRRHDYLVNVLQSLVETMLFFHPAVWWLSNVIRREREQCCDDLAAEACGDKVVVAKALVRLAEVRTRPAQGALAATGGRLSHRIRRLLDVPVDSRSRSAAGSLLAILLVSAIVVVVGVFTSGLGERQAEAQESKPEAKDPQKPAGKTPNDEPANGKFTEGEIDQAILRDPQIQKALADLAALMRQKGEVEKAAKNHGDPAYICVQDKIASLKQSIEDIKNADRKQLIEHLHRAGQAPPVTASSSAAAEAARPGLGERIALAPTLSPAAQIVPDTDHATLDATQTAEVLSGPGKRLEDLRAKLLAQIQFFNEKFNRLVASEQEVKAVEVAHQNGTVTRDLLIQAQERLARAEVAAENASAEAAAGRMGSAKGTDPTGRIDEMKLQLRQMELEDYKWKLKVAQAVEELRAEREKSDSEIKHEADAERPLRAQLHELDRRIQEKKELSQQIRDEISHIQLKRQADLKRATEADPQHDPVAQFQDQEKAELAKLEGTWKLVSLVIGAKDYSVETCKNSPTWTFHRHEIVVVEDKPDGGSNVHLLPPGDGYRVFVNPTKTEKQISIVGKDLLAQGIYRLDGETMMISCFQGSEFDRPTSFKPSTDDVRPRWVCTLRRVNGESKQSH